MKIRKKSKNLTIDEKLFEVLLRSETIGKGTTPPMSTENFLKIWKMDFFQIEKEDDFYLDSVKLLWMVILVSKEEVDKKIKYFIEIIHDDKIRNKKDENFSFTIDKFTKNDLSLLYALEMLSSWAIYPYVVYFEGKPEVVEDEDFVQYYEYATINQDIFFDFARYLTKNYIFYENSRSSTSKPIPNI